MRGDVKIFDFGLAKEIQPETAVDGVYKLTGATGLSCVFLRILLVQLYSNKFVSRRYWQPQVYGSTRSFGSIIQRECGCVLDVYFVVADFFDGNAF